MSENVEKKTLEMREQINGRSYILVVEEGAPYADAHFFASRCATKLSYDYGVSMQKLAEEQEKLKAAEANPIDPEVVTEPSAS